MVLGTPPHSHPARVLSCKGSTRTGRLSCTRVLCLVTRSAQNLAHRKAGRCGCPHAGVGLAQLCQGIPSVGDEAHGPALGWPGRSRTDPQGRSALGPAGPTATGRGPTWWSREVLPGAWAPACQESPPCVVYPSVPQQALGPNELSRGATLLWSSRAQETHRQRGGLPGDGGAQEA